MGKTIILFFLSCIVWCRWWYTFLERLFSRKYKRRTRWSIFLFYVWHNIKERITILCIFCCLFICSHKYLLNDSKHNWINVSISEECICNDEASDVLFDMRCRCILFALFVICVNGCLFYILFVFICVALNWSPVIVFIITIICPNDSLKFYENSLIKLNPMLVQWTAITI